MTTIHSTPEILNDNTEMAPLVTLLGRIIRIGYYRDTLPQLAIYIRKETADLLPWREGERVPVSLQHNGERYLAGIRSTQRSADLIICPDMTDSAGKPVRLTDVLLQHGFTSCDRIEMVVDREVLHIR